MNKEDLFDIAEAQFKARKNNTLLIDDPNFYKFPLEIENETKAKVVVCYGKIKEIEVFYPDGSIQTVRPE